jgi:uncharacterized protein
VNRDFDDTILDTVQHRPWGMSRGPWLMTQTWNDLLFAHWPVDSAELRSRIPSPFAIDLFEGGAWIGIVPFHMTNVAPRGIPPVPWLSAFPELNVRTYVRGLTLPDRPPLLHFAKRQDMVAWAPVGLGSM